MPRLGSPAEPIRPRRVHTVVVCLETDSPPAALPEQARTELARHGLATDGVIPHFPARTRRTSRLIDRWHGMTSGGPLRLLGLESMRSAAAAAASAEWHLWHQVVADTRPAQPFWHFADKHTADPDRYPLSRAQADYLAQPRVVAMNLHNALPHRICLLPTSALEAYQAGDDSWVNLAWLAAVPADGLVTVDHRWSTTAGERLAEQVTYLQMANAVLASLPPSTQLAAMAVPLGSEPDCAPPTGR